MSSIESEEQKVLLAEITLLQEEINKRIEEIRKRILKQTIVTEEDKATPKTVVVKESAIIQEEELKFKTILQVKEGLENKDSRGSLCDPKKKFAIYGQLLGIRPGGKNPNGKRFPAKIVITDDELRKFEGIIWSESLEKDLYQLKDKWLIFTSVYMRRVSEKKYENKDCLDITTAFNEELIVSYKSQFSFQCGEDSTVREYRSE